MTGSAGKFDLYRQLFHSSNAIMLLVKPDVFTIQDFNDAAIQFYGYDREEFADLRWPDLVASSPDGFLDALNFDAIEKYRKPCQHLLKSGEVRDVDLQISHIVGNGTNLLFIIITDISEKLRQEKERNKTLEMLQLMIDTLPNPIYCKNRDARYIMCNAAFERFFGRKRENIYGLCSYDLGSKEYADKYHNQDLEMIRECEEQISQDIFQSNTTSDVKVFLKNREPIEYEIQLRNADGKMRDVLIRKDIYFNSQQQAGIIGIFIDVTDRKIKEEELRMLHTALGCTPEFIVTMDFNWKATYVNNSFTSRLGYRLEDVNCDNSHLKKIFEELLPESDLYLIASGINWQVLEGEGNITARNGQVIAVSFRLTPIIDQANDYKGILALITDMSEIIKEKEQKRMVELQLRQAQKLEAIGHLAAGIAHELNTPIQFVGDNINFLSDTFKDFISLFQSSLSCIQQYSESGALSEESLTAIKSQFEELDFEYLSTEVPSAFEQSLDGVKRISDIVRAMKDFSHPGSGERSGLDINKAITSTATVARNEWKYVCDVVFDLENSMPPVPCYEGEFKQVILNIIVNAAHAIGDALKQNNAENSKGEIKISTRHDDKWAYVDIADTGSGIPEQYRNKVFDPFFTTKETGRGTGQGLAISYDVIVNKHHGQISFDTEMGKGTVFHLCLPME